MIMIDILIIITVIFGALLGFRRGIITQTVAFVGFILIFLIAYFTKDYLAFYLCKWLPFLKIDLGTVKNLVTLNILFYEMLAFLIIFSLLMFGFRFLMTFTEVFEAILKSTVILALPLKIGGAIVGAIEYALISLLVLVFLASPMFSWARVDKSYLADKMFEVSAKLKLPLADIIDTVNTISEVEKINYKKSDTAELKVLDAMLKNKVTTLKIVDMLVKDKKLELDNIETVLDKYRK